jgi:hypothetical protein
VALAAGAVLLAAAFAVLGIAMGLPREWSSAGAWSATGHEAAARERAWQHAQPLLEQADRQAAEALNRHLQSIHDFLAQRRPGARAFAQELLGLRGKWELVKSQLTGDGQEQYAQFLSQAFAEHLFASDELEQAVGGAIRGYLAELDGIEERLLVQLRANLADDELPLQGALPALSSDQAFQNRFHELSEQLAGDLNGDLLVVAGREAVLWETIPVATDLTLKAGEALATRLGLARTILSAGTAGSWRSFGTSLVVGIVVTIVLDAVINQIIKAAGYDAEQQIADRIAHTLDGLAVTLTDGNPEARATLEQLQGMERNDPDPQVRQACTEAIHSIEAGTQLYGLRPELAKLAAARASLRKETLRRFLQLQETP